MKKKFAVSITIGGKDKLSKPISKGTRKLGKMKLMAKATGRSLGKLGSTMKRVGGIAQTSLKMGFIGAGIAIGAIAFAIKKLSDSFRMIEDAEASFTPLLGSVAKAKILVGKLNETAATTPFQFETLSNTAKQLLPSMNGNIEETIRLTRMMGDTAGGSAKNMESITRGFNKVLIKGKVDMESLNMIADAGVPIFQQLGKEMGLSGEKLFARMRKGKIGVQDLTKTFETMTSKGGIFFKGMEIASKTLSGKISTMKDVINLAMAEIGGAMAPVLKDLADDITKVAKTSLAWAKANKDIIASKFKEYVKLTIDKIKELYNWISKNKKELKEFGRGVLKFGETLLNITKWAIKNKMAVLGIVGAIAAIKVTAGIASLITSLKSIAMLTGASGVAGAAGGGGVVVNASKQISGLNGMLGKAGLVGAAAAAGVAIGLLITSLLNSSQDKSLKTANSSALESRGISKMSNTDLDAFLAKQKQILKNATGFGSNMTDLFSGRDENKNLRDNAVMAMQTIHDEKRMRERARERKLNVANIRSTPAFTSSEPGMVQQMMTDTRPAVSMSQPQETIKTEKVELVIRDETGKAEVTQDTSGNGFHLALTQTGVS